MIKIVVLSGLIWFGTQPAMAEVIAVGGKPYEIYPYERVVCGERGSPDYAVAVSALAFTQKFSEGTYKASCDANLQTKCDPSDIKKAGVGAVFTFIRKYPSYASVGCKDLRGECENLCRESKVFDEKICVIECGQYETWNR